MLSGPIILIIIVITFLLVALYLEWFRPSVSFFIAIIALVVGGVLSPKEALSGFGNEQLAVIVLLLIISDIFKKSSVINVLFDQLFGKRRSLTSFNASIMLTVGSLSAVFNNTPLVAMMMPYVNSWSSKHKISASKLLIPLSYAAILGGSITLIGTSTNLIVNGLAVDAGFPSLSIFDFTAVVLTMFVIGVVYLLIFGNKLLPNKQTDIGEIYKESRKFFIETQVQEGSKLIGKSIGSVGLRNLKGLYLIQIIRNGRNMAPVAP